MRHIVVESCLQAKIKAAVTKRCPYYEEREPDSYGDIHWCDADKPDDSDEAYVSRGIKDPTQCPDWCPLYSLSNLQWRS